MISLWVAIAVVAAVALAPLGLSLRRRATERGRREAALELHRAQLVELDRNLADARIGPTEHAAAVLEVQRRLLAAAAASDPEPSAPSRSAIWAVLAMVPIAAVLLYLVGGSPDLPALPLKERLAAMRERVREEKSLIAQLQQVLGGLDPHSEKAREGYILLGDAEARLGNMQAAASAWQSALADRFDPTLAVEAAEALTEANGHVTDAAAALFRRALADAPQNAPWRAMAQRRLNGD
jgi:cytochrome c-type biogenesis protein CcmH